MLLLDEPTNHLDIDAITWLEGFLSEYAGAVVFVTHDRAFLQRLATRIVELDRGRLTSWPGDYATFLRRKEEWLANEAVQQEKFDKKLAQEEVWLRQGIKARRTRNEGRVRALMAMRQERAARRDQIGAVRMRAEQADQSGKLVFEARGVSKAYGPRPVVDDVSVRVMRGDRIGLIGPNGAGKTTFLRLLIGELAPDRGEVREGANVQVAYYDQQREQLDPERTVFDVVGDGNDTVTVNGQSRHVHSYLRDFLFSDERARSPVKALSGGERNRLLLARLFTRPSNVLVLDEPTNDLDLETLELLEAQLAEWPGTLLLVSHDRTFLDNVVTSTLAFEGQGRVTENVGGYEDWLRQSRRQGATRASQAGAATAARAAAQATTAAPVARSQAVVQGATRARRLAGQNRDPRGRAAAAAERRRGPRVLQAPSRPDCPGHGSTGSARIRAPRGLRPLARFGRTRVGDPVSILQLAAGPHPRRELTPTPRLGFQSSARCGRRRSPETRRMLPMTNHQISCSSGGPSAGPWPRTSKWWRASCRQFPRARCCAERFTSRSIRTCAGA